MPHVDRLGDSRFGRLDSLPPPFHGRSLREEVHTRLTYSVLSISERPHFRGPTSKEGLALTSQQSTDLATYSVFGIGVRSGSDQRDLLHGAMSRASHWYWVFPCALHRQGRVCQVVEKCSARDLPAW